MCGLSEFRVTDNELTLCGELARSCLVELRLTSEDRIRRYAADFARLALPGHECGEGRIDLDRRRGVVVRLRMMAVGPDQGIDEWYGPAWGMPLRTRETAPARLYDRAGDDRQGEGERGRGLGPGTVIEKDGTMSVKFSTSWRG